MYLAYTAEQEDLRSQLRAYYSELLDDRTVVALRKDPAGPVMREVVRQMGTDGWLGFGWPTEFGGQGRSPMEQFIFFDESMRAGAPVPMLTVNTVGPTIMEFGTEEQKNYYLPAILRGEMHFCIGYSEPGAGTDLAALRTTAVLDGDQYVINGQKMWTSYARTADYCWLAARTDSSAKKHRGISMMLVPMDTPGITIQPVSLMGDHEVAAVYYDDVRIPADNVVGGVGQGWNVIITQLNRERVTLCSPGMVDRMLHDVRAWAQRTHLPDGRKIADQEWVRINMARAYAGFEFLKLINWKVASDAAHDVLRVEDASTTKVFGTETYLDVIKLLMEIVGQRAYLKEDAVGSILDSQLERMYRDLVILTFGGGVNEVQRDLIGLFGLGLPFQNR
ncbi:acyl-CoA dehydrogenase family protein [Nocardia tengchongensis]|uniref:acyl-CoA dehydrogenase family protein n=1 Tax=Nocardia tengchongensis TaxID=2055889 RepID=UPI0036821D5E